MFYRYLSYVEYIRHILGFISSLYFIFIMFCTVFILCFHIILVSILYNSRNLLIFFLLVFSRTSFYFLMITIKRLYITDYMSELKAVNLTFLFSLLFYFILHFFLFLNLGLGFIITLQTVTYLSQSHMIVSQ